jgi:hypothetical protein
MPLACVCVGYSIVCDSWPSWCDHRVSPHIRRDSISPIVLSLLRDATKALDGAILIAIALLIVGRPAVKVARDCLRLPEPGCALLAVTVSLVLAFGEFHRCSSAMGHLPIRKRMAAAIWHLFRLHPTMGRLTPPAGGRGLCRRNCVSRDFVAQAH